MEHKTTKENTRVAKAAGIVGMATMLSRIFGFIRDMVVAAFFGAGLHTDAFFVAFRIPNLLRRLLGEGSLTASFVPVFTEYMKVRSKDAALELAHIAFTILSVILVVVSILGIIFSPAIITVMAPGFVHTPSQFELAVFLNRIMFPYIFFISLVALCMGILNSLRHFAAPALSPVILNLSMIGAAFCLRGFFEQPIVALAIGVLIGGVLQLAMQRPFLRKMGVSLRFNFKFNHPGIKQMGRLLIPTLIGSGIYQINIFVGTILASLLPKGSVSFLYYADRIVELPLGVFAIAVGTATLPSFSSQVVKGDMEDFKRTISFSMRLILFITIPASVALIALREPILSVLFQRGAFSAQSTILTAQALLYYTLGLWAFSIIRVIDSAFFSLQDRRSPLKAAVVALIVNIACSVTLMFPLKHGGLALATSIASAVNVIMLMVILKKKIGSFLLKDFYISFMKTTMASLAMLGTVALIFVFLPWNTTAPFKERLLFLTASISAGIVIFFLTAHLIRCPEMTAITTVIKRKFASFSRPQDG